jgi:hypothetical protein
MISGEYDLITGAALGVQKTCTTSQPVLSAEMAAKKGAPVYSSHPPTTATRPAWPFLFADVSEGTNDARGSRSSRSASALAARSLWNASPRVSKDAVRRAS